MSEEAFEIKPSMTWTVISFPNSSIKSTTYCVMAIQQPESHLRELEDISNTLWLKKIRSSMRHAFNVLFMQIKKHLQKAGWMNDWMNELCKGEFVNMTKKKKKAQTHTYL